MDRLQPLRVFSGVAELRSFAVTARDLGLSPPVVTRMVAELGAWPLSSQVVPVVAPFHARYPEGRVRVAPRADPKQPDTMADLPLMIVRCNPQPG